MNDRKIGIVLAAAFGILLALDGGALAQGFPGGGHGQGRGSNRAGFGNERGDAPKRNASDAPVREPALALEVELPSLRNDLLLDANQSDAWTAFEQSVHEAAQVARARERRIAAARQATLVGGVDVPMGAALNSLKDLVDDQKNRADVLSDVAAALGNFAKLLDPRQSGVLNRRIVQALQERASTT